MPDERTEAEKAASREQRLSQLGINKPGKSLSEIAAMMEANRKQMQGDEPRRRPVQAKRPNEVDSEDDLDEELDEGEDEEAQLDDEELEAQSDDHSGSADDDDTDDDTDSGDQHEFDELDIDDDDLIEIEGVDEPVSFKVLKEVYNADKTVVKKVQEAEENYAKAFEISNKATTQAEEMQTAMKTLVTGLEQALMQPLISKPDPRLKEENPTRYIQHYEAYQQDQERISQTREQIMQALDQHANNVQEARKQTREAEMARLVQKLEPLRDETQRKQASKDILDAASYFGFQPEEVNAAADHRMFQMAYYAQQYLKLKGMSAEEKEDRTTKIKEKLASQPRIMRSKGSKPTSSSAQKRVKILKTKASKSGKPEDVANFMAARRSVRTQRPN